MLAKYRDRILTLAAAIRATPPEHFDMGSWFSDHHTGETFSTLEDIANGLSIEAPTTAKIAETVAHSCKTAACVAGWCVLVFPKANGAAEKAGQSMFRQQNTPGADAMVYLGLSELAARALFYPAGSDLSPEDYDEDDQPITVADYTPDRAADTLTRLANEGVVDWGLGAEPVAYNA